MLFPVMGWGIDPLVANRARPSLSRTWVCAKLFDLKFYPFFLRIPLSRSPTGLAMKPGEHRRI